MSDTPTKKLDINQNCPFGCPETVVETAAKPQKTEKSRAGHMATFRDLSWHAQQGKIPDTVIIETAQRQLQRAPIFVRGDKSCTGLPWKGSVRGDEWSATKKNAKILAYCNELDKLPGDTLFVTLSCDTGQYNGNILSAWRDRRPFLQHFFRRLKRWGLVDYVGVTEAYDSGYPHYHVIIKWLDRTIPWYQDRHGKYRPQDYAIKEYLDSSWRGGFTDVQVIVKGAVAGYVSKYVSKSIVEVSREGFSTEKKAHASERKQMLSTLMPIMVGCHSVLVSRRLKTIVGGRARAKREELELAEWKELIGQCKRKDGSLDLLLLMCFATRRCVMPVYKLHPRLAKSLFPSGELAEIAPEEWQRARDGPLVRLCQCSNCTFVKSVYDELRNRKKPKE